VKQFKNGTDAEISSVTRQKILKSDCKFEEDIVVCGDKDMVLFNKKVDSRINDGNLTELVGVGRTVIKTHAHIFSENNSLLEHTSNCRLPKKRLIACDCLPQKLPCKNIETENVLTFAGYGKNFLVSGLNRDEKGRLHQASETKPDSESTPRPRRFKLKRNNVGIAGPALKRSRVTNITSNVLKNAQVFVQVPVHIMSHVGSQLKTNDTYCPETGESGCVRPGQPLASISGDSFKSCSVPVMSSSVCDESSSVSFNVAGSSVAQSTDLSSQTKTNPPTISELPSKYPNTSLNDLGKRKELLPGDIKGNSVILKDEEHVLQKIDNYLNYLMEDSARKPLAVSYTEQGNKDIDTEPLPGDIKDDSVILDAEVDMLREIDGLLNYLC
jgi:hypothetical protein